MRRLISMIAFLCCIGSMAHAQERIVVVDTNYPEAQVFADAVYLGTAAQRQFLVPASARHLRLVTPNIDTWSVPPVLATLPEAGDSLSLQLDFPYTYRIETFPFGATVYLETPAERLELGETPLLHQADQPLEGTLVVDRRGYMPERWQPGREIWNRSVITLRPALRPEEPVARVDWSPPKQRKRWINYAASGLALTAGALAAYYRFKANDLDDRCQGDSECSLQPQIDRYNTRAIVALGAMQVGVGVLTIRLAMR